MTRFEWLNEYIISLFNGIFERLYTCTHSLMHHSSVSHRAHTSPCWFSSTCWNLFDNISSLCWTWSGEEWVNMISQWKACDWHWLCVLGQVTLLGLSSLNYMIMEFKNRSSLELLSGIKFWNSVLQIHININEERTFKGSNVSKSKYSSSVIIICY